MKALLFLSPRFVYAPFAPTIPEAGPPPLPQEVREAVVVFVHCEEGDVQRRASIFSRLLKQIKWLAGKRGFRSVVLHSFTHLSSSKAPPDFAQAFLEELAGRLQKNGYQVAITPFGYTCSWELAVYGESLAKVFVSF